MKASLLQTLRRFSLAPCVCFALAWLLGRTEWAQHLEWKTLDWRTALRTHYQPPPDRRISIVLFGDDTDANLVGWPPDRAVHADMIKLLTLAQPKTIAWDVILDASREGEGDAQMGRAAQIARRAGVDVISAAVTNPDLVEDRARPQDAGPTRPLRLVSGDTGKLVGDRDGFRPFPELRRESWYGFADAPHDATDGVQREIPLVVRMRDAVYPSFALQTLMRFFDVPDDQVRVKLGETIDLPTATRGILRLPITERGTYWVNYRYDQDEVGSDFPTWEYRVVMIALNDRFLEDKVLPVRLREMVTQLRGGMVLIGQTVAGKADAGATPLSGYSPLILVHANLINNVLAGDFLRRASSWVVMLGALVTGYGAVWLGARRPVWVLMASVVLTVAVYGTAAFAAWIKWSLWLPMVWPMAGFGALEFMVIGRRAWREQQGREQVKRMFGTYLSPELLKKMVREGVSVAAVSSERRPVTILFSDLRDFTALTERVGDAELVAQLNEYLAAMVECIHREGGTLHKFIGDAVMAVWGDLTSAGAADDARRAVRAALAMQARLAELNSKWRGEGRPELRMGIGLNHGTVLIGNIGSPRRMEFTAIGDAVNLASRLESLNKALGTTLLVGESMGRLIGSAFALRPRGALEVKGKAQPVEVFEVVGAS